jgi:2-C-methyl-D-erythritol 4-phosphate cytidylyltransferase/2-C-methyl-D-erythritol 2,4-cyclodiphosphate synthase
MAVTYWLVVPAAGAGRRSGAAEPKQYRSLAGDTLLERSLRPFALDPRCVGLCIALGGGDTQGPPLVAAMGFKRVLTAAGGAERCHSVLQALDLLAAQAQAGDWVLVHDAARPLVAAVDIDALLANCSAAGAGGLLAQRVTETVKRAAGERVARTESREDLWRAQTPQMFRLGELRAALRTAIDGGRLPTDEAQAMEWAGAQPLLIAGSAHNIKVTLPEDFALAESLLAARGAGRGTMRTGFGIDVHAFGAGDHVMLGGVRIAHDRGVVAHSDGDVLLHALCDALLGAAALGDIGVHFPDSEPRWRGAASARFVTEVMRLLAQRGLRPVHADLTLLSEAPRIGPQRAEIVARIAELLGLSASDVNLKATTTEKLGFIGRKEGLAAQAVVTVATI